MKAENSLNQMAALLCRLYKKGELPSLFLGATGSSSTV